METDTERSVIDEHKCKKNEVFCKKGAFFVIFLKSLLYLICRVKELDDRKISPIFNPVLMRFLIIDYMENSISLMKMEADISAIHAMLQEVKEQTIGKVYNTQELSEYLKVGKAVIDKLRQDGELEFSKLGRTIVYTQRDIEKLLEKNHFSFVA